MYYIVYAVLYLISLLPFFILYLISDLAYFILYYLVGYRKKVVLDNLSIAFPEKSFTEKRSIMRKFYRNLTDTFIETIKLLSISQKNLDRRNVVDFSLLDQLQNKGLNVQLHSGHQMNWEYANLAFSKKSKVPWIGIYMQISSKVMEKLFLKIRRKYNAVLISARDFTKTIRSFYNQQYILALIADQNPGIPKNAQWLYFFNKPAPFMASPEKGAIRNGTAVVFVNFIKVRRGYYRYDTELITENASDMQDGELTRLYRDFLEKGIRSQPDNYLWSHRRWKFSYDESFEKRWIDLRNAPEG